MTRQSKNRSWTRQVCVFACVASAPFLSACAKPASPVSHQEATYAPPAPPPEAAQPEKKSRFGEAQVYVDGLTVGVVRAAELPPSLRPLSLKGMDASSKIYCLSDYVRALGVDLAKVRGVQIYGGKRVAVLDGDEFRRVGGRLRFAFTGNDRGKPGLLWPHEHLKINTVVGTLSSLTIYVDKEPPSLNAEGALVYADGTLVTGVPYAPAEQSKGTRVYVDGKLAGVVKRKALPSNLLVGDDLAHPTFSMAGYLSSIGVNAKDARAIDFVSGDDTFLRVPSSQSEKAKSLTFTIPAHSQGQIAMPRPSDGSQTDPGTLKVSAVQLFVKSAPPSREISVPPAALNGGGGSGSGDSKQEDSALE